MVTELAADELFFLSFVEGSGTEEVEEELKPEDEAMPNSCDEKENKAMVDHGSEPRTCFHPGLRCRQENLHTRVVLWSCCIRVDYWTNSWNVASLALC